MANVLTVVFDKAEQTIDSVIAAAVNELHALGHTVKEVRITTDTGEAKIPLNTVAGVALPEPTVASAAAVPAEPEAPAVESTEITPDGDETLPVDTPPTPETLSPLKQREEALLAELAAVRQQEEAEATPAADPSPPTVPAS